MKSYRQVYSAKTIAEAVAEATEALSVLGDEMREWADSLVENFSHTEKYEVVSETASELEDVDDIDVPAEVKDVEVKFYTAEPKNKKRAPSRAIRRDNAVAGLEAVIEAMEDDEREAVEDFRGEVEELRDKVQDLDFPSMYG